MSLLNIMYSITFEPYLERSSCIYIYCSFHETGWLKIDFEIGFSILCFQRRPQHVNLHQLHCDVECFGYNRWKSQKMYISNLNPSQCSEVLLCTCSACFTVSVVSYTEPISFIDKPGNLQSACLCSTCTW